MNILKAPIESVVPWDKNPRGIKTKDYERLKKQILKLGVYKPLIAFKEKDKYVVLGGNMRIRALKDMGLKEVEISVVNPTSEAQKIEFALSDNDRAGFYEEDKLAELVIPEIAHLELTDYKIDLGEPWVDLKRVIERFGPDLGEPRDEWQGMPEFEQEDKLGFRNLIVHFKDAKAVVDFFKLIKQTATEKTKYIWFPEAERDDRKSRKFVNES